MPSSSEMLKRPMVIVEIFPEKKSVYRILASTASRVKGK
jgi:hypothetical protein